MSWLVISAGVDGFAAKPQDDLVETDYIVAEHPDEASALAGVKRAQQLERQMRPLWCSAIEHEQRVKNTMLSAVYAAAKPITSEGE